MLTWLLGFDCGRKFLLYCSDVAGAFDRVSAQRLTEKLTALGVPPDWVRLFSSWLRSREALVVVGGAYSKVMSLVDMVFQGTVWGPPLWNAFYKDARRAVRDAGFEEEVYADDLNAYKAFPTAVKNEELFEEGRRCQEKLHKWGRANQVCFDPTKESFHVFARTGGQGGNTELLGVNFDTGLAMDDAVRGLVQEVAWKLRVLQRSARFHTGRELVNLYKSRVLGYVEYRTPALYHATCTTLQQLNKVQDRLLRLAGVADLEALMHFNLAPLATRRDVAMLGLIHRTVLGKGPEHFQRFFVKAPQRGAYQTRLQERQQRHGRQLVDPRGRTHLNCVRRSALGLVAVYNLLPAHVVRAETVKEFQTQLQELLKARAREGCEDWSETFSPRIPLYRHPLR